MKSERDSNEGKKGAQEGQKKETNTSLNRPHSETAEHNIKTTG